MIKLTSGQVAQLTNISKSTLRHYVDKELVTPSVSNENGYHFFKEKDLYMVFQIKMLRTIGFSIEEIRASFRVDYFGDHFDEIYNRTKDQIDELEAIKDKLLKLKEIKKSITIGKTEVVFCSDRYLKKLPESYQVGMFQLDYQTLSKLKQSDFDLSAELYYMYHKTTGETLSYYEGSSSSYDKKLEAGNYAVKHFLANSEQKFEEEVAAFMKDSLFLLGFVATKDLYIHENSYLSLGYSDEMVYSIEVRVK